MEHSMAFVSRAMGLGSDAVCRWKTRGVPADKQQLFAETLRSLPRRTTMAEVFRKLNALGFTSRDLAVMAGVSEKSSREWLHKEYVPVAHEEIVKSVIFNPELSDSEATLAYRKNRDLVNEERELQKMVFACKSSLRHLIQESSITAMKIEIMEAEARLSEVREELSQLQQYL